MREESQPMTLTDCHREPSIARQLDPVSTLRPTRDYRVEMCQL